MDYVNEEVWENLSRMRDLASMYVQIQRRDEAENLCLEVIEEGDVRQPSKEQCLTILLPTRSILASIYERQSKWQEATVQRNSILATMTALLGDQHPDTLRSRSDLARLLVWQGNRKEGQGLESAVTDGAQGSTGQISHHNREQTLEETPSLADPPEERSKPSRQWLNPGYTDSARIRSIIASSETVPTGLCKISQMSLLSQLM